MTTDVLAGKKTYGAALIMFVWSIVGLAFGWLDAGTAIEFMVGSLAIFGIGKKIERNGK